MPMNISGRRLPIICRGICVRDANGAYSQYVTLYSVTNLPAVFLVNRANELSARGETITNLEESIEKTLVKNIIMSRICLNMLHSMVLYLTRIV